MMTSQVLLTYMYTCMHDGFTSTSLLIQCIIYRGRPFLYRLVARCLPINKIHVYQLTDFLPIDNERVIAKTFTLPQVCAPKWTRIHPSSKHWPNYVLVQMYLHMPIRSKHVDRPLKRKLVYCIKTSCEWMNALGENGSWARPTYK